MIILWVLIALGTLPVVVFALLLIYFQVSGLVLRGECRFCGCTDRDCSACIAKTGEPCCWIDEAHTVCSRCVDEFHTEIRDDLSPQCSPLNSRAKISHG
jgi:hypothetical protein